MILDKMVEEETMSHGDQMEMNLIKQDKRWKTMDKLLLAFGVLVNFGDGVEIYLPGESTRYREMYDF